jgi:hypothetical protein
VIKLTQIADETYNTRKLLTGMQNNMRELRSNMFNRIDMAEHRSRLNVETIKQILEQGGNTKLRKAAREGFGGNNIIKSEPIDDILEEEQLQQENRSRKKRRDRNVSEIPTINENETEVYK